MLHQTGCTCRSCTGPNAWRHLLANSLPAWICPTRRSPQVNTPDADITLDAIIQGHTKSPITYQDLRRFLKHSSDGTNLAALDFLMAFKKFQENFLHLFPSDRPPHPYTVIEYLSLSQASSSQPPSAVSTGSPAFQPPSPISPIPSAGLLGYRSRNRAVTTASIKPPQSEVPSHLPARPRAATLQGTSQTTINPKRGAYVNSMIMDPSSQPLRPELEHLVRRYLTDSMSHNLSKVIPPQMMAQALSETKLTTHPSTLAPVATFLHNYLADQVVPTFLNQAVINLSRTTSVGRLLMSLAILGIALALTIVFILFETRIPRPARLALLPFYLISIGYAIGSRTSLCFWLTWRGVRETKQYEDEEKALVAEREFRSNWAPREDRFTPLEDFQTRKQKKTRRPSDTDSFSTSNTSENYRLSVYTINESYSEKALLPSPRSPIFTRNRYHTSATKAFYFNRIHYRRWTWDKLIRLTGTAVNTVRVEDERIRHRQRVVALKVSIWLIIGTVSIMTVVMVIP
ncbi:hypothetical protein FRC02_008623 [Tulasnella sp. 418]|nr:hypothetical protein FRC02_008623 [Tulasnella sp. 418]